MFEFEDIDKGIMKRDESGNLIVLDYLPRSLPGDLNSGQADFHKFNTNGGVVVSQADLESTPAIGQIFNTKIMLINDSE